MKIKITKLDKLFSEYIRKRAKNKCQRCGKWVEFKKLQTCHLHGRRKKSVRWDVENAIACDFGCHRQIDENPYEKIRLFVKIFGVTEINKLNIRAEIPQKPDVKALTLYLEQKLK